MLLHVANHPLFEFHLAKETINLGILTYTHKGRPVYNSNSKVHYAQLSLYEDDSCSGTPTQKYELIASQLRQLNVDLKGRSVGMSVNCHIAQMVSIFPLGYWQEGNITFAAASFLPGECVTASIPEGTMSLQVTCEAQAANRPAYYANTEWGFSNSYGVGLVPMRNGGKMTIGDACMVTACYSPSNGTVSVYGNSDCTGTPTLSLNQNSIFHVQLGNGASIWVWPQCWSLTDSDSLLTSVERAKCVLSYAKCVDIGYEIPLTQWTQYSPGCDKNLPVHMCEHCKEAGSHVHVMIALTCALQLPAVWISMIRTHASQDSRWYKFLMLPIGLVVGGGTVNSLALWYHSCLYPIQDEMAEAVVEYLDSAKFAESYSFGRGWAYLPLMAACLTFCISMHSLLTPVPELYQHQCLDPDTIEPVPNRLSRPPTNTIAGVRDIEKPPG